MIWILDNEWPDYELEKRLLKDYFPNTEVIISRDNFEKDAIKYGDKIEGVLCQVSIKLDKNILNKLEKCKCISVFGTGYENIDIETCQNLGISVVNVRGYCNDDISDYTLAAILNHNKPIDYYHDNLKLFLKEGKWGAETVVSNTRRLSKQTALIVGFGNIGKAIAKKLKNVGMRVIINDDYMTEEQVSEYGFSFVSWEEGFKQADYISVNIRGIEVNRDRIGKKEFELMKNSALIINTSRGLVIDETELIKAVNNKNIGGAVLDVIKEEPPNADDPIINTKGIMVTPHISYASVDSLLDLRTIAVENLVENIKNNI